MSLFNFGIPSVDADITETERKIKEEESLPRPRAGEPMYKFARRVYGRDYLLYKEMWPELLAKQKAKAAACSARKKKKEERKERAQKKKTTSLNSYAIYLELVDAIKKEQTVDGSVEKRLVKLEQENARLKAIIKDNLKL